MRTSLLLTSALVACALDPAALPGQAATPPPPGVLTVQVEGRLESGTDLTLRYGLAQPGERVFLTWGRAPVGTGTPDTCPPGLGGRCLGIQQPSLLAIPDNPTVADAQGVATFTMRVPGPTRLPDGFLAWVQAATVGASPALSSLVALPELLDDPARRQALKRQRFAMSAQPGGTLDASVYTTYTSQHHGLTICDLFAGVTGTAVPLATSTCPSCDWVFDVTFGTALSPNPTGTCAAMQIDPTPDTTRVAYDADHLVGGIPTPTIFMEDGQGTTVSFTQLGTTATGHLTWSVSDRLVTY